MSVYLDKKTKRYLIQFQFQGHPYKRRLPDGTTKAEAQRLETKWKHDLFFDSHGAGDKTPEPLWKDFVENEYLEYVAANHSPGSLAKAIHICRAAAPFFKGMTPRQVKPFDVERFKAIRMATRTLHGHPRRAATIHREMSIISRVFSMAVKNDLCDYNPCSRVDLPKFDNIQDRILRMEDEEKFLLAFRNGLQKDICTVVLYTGLRQNDVLGLTAANVDWNDGVIQIIQGKTRRRVRIPMHPIVQGILERRANDGLFFVSYRTGKQARSIKNSIRFACVRAGIPILTIRDLRRTFGTRLHELGYDDKTVADLLGHSDLRSVHRYKRGTEIQRKAILDLGNSAKIHASGLNGLLPDTLEPNKTLVEMRRIELLASALRTPDAVTIIH